MSYYSFSTRAMLSLSLSTLKWKAKSLGIEYIPLETSLKETVESLKGEAVYQYIFVKKAFIWVMRHMRIDVVKELKESMQEFFIFFRERER